MNNAAESAELKAACFDLARTAKWAQRPIDSEEITELAGKFESVAISRVYEPLNIDVTLVARAVRYITQAHGMPTGDDTGWFDEMLRALIEVARPNSGLDERGKEFLNDMLDGIQEQLE
jgi:hypothetical protein